MSNTRQREAKKVATNEDRGIGTLVGKESAATPCIMIKTSKEIRDGIKGLAKRSGITTQRYVHLLLEDAIENNIQFKITARKV